MIKTSLLVIVLFLTTISYAADKEGKFAIKGVGNSSCKNFLELSEKASLNKFLYAGWMNGYLTAQNQHLNTTFDLTSWETIHTLGEYLRNYCEKNPDKSFYIAMASMVNGLFENRVQSFSPTESFGTGKNGIKIYQNSLARVQSNLKKLGLYNGTIDGKNTEETQKAIRAFQEKNQFIVTGIPDQQTLHALLVQE